MAYDRSDILRTKGKHNYKIAWYLHRSHVRFWMWLYAGRCTRQHSEFAICHVVSHGNVNSIQNPSTATNPTMEPYCILLPLTLPCRTTWQIANSLISSSRTGVYNDKCFVPFWNLCNPKTCFKKDVLQIRLVNNGSVTFTSQDESHGDWPITARG